MRSSSLVESTHQSVARIRLNRPERLNSYDLELLVRLHQAIEHNSQRDDIRVIILSGEGTAFCSGCEIRHLLRLLERKDLKSFRRMQDVVKQIILLLRRIPQITLASMDGVACDGGLNIALSCDLRISTSRSILGYPFAQLGWIPEVGTTHSLRGLTGSLNSFELLARGRLLNAEEAASMGLINQVVAPDELESVTDSTTETLARLAPIMVRHLKRSIFQGYQGLEKSMDQEVEARIRCFLSDDAREGIESFMENREAVFKGQ